ncbi:hypothetical protein NDU88_002818 [Pleurodeles waltl]|uniref:Secreted protein n=1 Tax=Pleurodeles waltl TaxID=8319 RepID=A0AAV7L047_PLEWA|nr:hypothetical protein NDU88_002818 [Pleurodeles waltl]
MGLWAPLWFRGKIAGSALQGTLLSHTRSGSPQSTVRHHRTGPKPVRAQIVPTAAPQLPKFMGAAIHVGCDRSGWVPTSAQAHVDVAGIKRRVHNI